MLVLYIKAYFAEIYCHDESTLSITFYFHEFIFFLVKSELVTKLVEIVH